MTSRSALAPSSQRGLVSSTSPLERTSPLSNSNYHHTSSNYKLGNGGYASYSSTSPSRLTNNNSPANNKLSMTYPRIRVRTSPSSVTSSHRLSNGRSPLYSTGNLHSNDVGLSADSTDLLDLDGVEEDVNAFDKRSEELLSGAGKRSLSLDECSKCKQFLDFATKLQAESKELKESIARLSETHEDERSAWAKEKEEIKNKFDSSKRKLQDELQQTSRLLDEEAKGWGRRVREMRAMLETEAASQSAKHRAEIDELNRIHERERNELRSKLVEAEGRNLHELERLKMELRVAQDATRSCQSSLDEARREKDVLREERETLIAKYQASKDTILKEMEQLKAELDALKFNKNQLDRETHEKLKRAEQEKAELQQMLESQQKNHVQAIEHARAQLEATWAQREESIRHELASNQQQSSSSSLADEERRELEEQIQHLKDELQVEKRESEQRLTNLRVESEMAIMRAQNEARMTLVQAEERDSELTRKERSEAEALRGEVERWKKAVESVKVVDSPVVQQQRKPKRSALGAIFLMVTFVASFSSLLLLVLVKSPPKLYSSYPLVHEMIATVREHVMNMLGIALAAPPS